MRAATLSITLAAGLLGLVGGCRGDAVKCDSACRNHYTLVFWEKADAAIAKLPADQQEQERSLAQARFVNSIESGIGTCTAQCQSANNESQMDCMIEAKTASAVRACTE